MAKRNKDKFSCVHNFVTILVYNSIIMEKCCDIIYVGFIWNLY